MPSFSKLDDRRGGKSLAGMPVIITQLGAAARLRHIVPYFLSAARAASGSHTYSGFRRRAR
jgi:hypothetical protein